MSELRAQYERKPGYVNNAETYFDESEVCLIHNKNDKTSDCKAYLAMTISERYELLKKCFACVCCLLPNHRTEYCSRKIECGNDDYTKAHHPSLYAQPYGVSTCSFVNDCPEEYDKAVILPIMKIKYEQNKFYNVLWDTAANLSLITKRKAKVMLQGKPIELSIIVAGGEINKIDSEMNVVPIIDINGHN